MNEGVKVLIERLKTNPEDFELVQSKDYRRDMTEGRFYWVTEQVKSYLTGQNTHYYLTLLKQEDIDALVNAFKEKHQQEFTDKVMRDLFKEEGEGEVYLRPTYSPLQGLRPGGIHAATWSNPRIAFQQQIQTQHLQAQMDARQQAMSQQQQAMVGITSAHTGTGKGLLGGLTGLFK